MKCDTCGREVEHTKCDLQGDRKWKCAICYYGNNSGAAPIPSEVKEGWMPQDIEGFSYMLPDNWPGKYWKDGICKVRPIDKAHERATLDAIGCHVGERGEKISNNGTLEFKGHPKVRSKTTVFLGKHRKASTCR